MASSPPYSYGSSVSPPYPSHTSLPLKRPSDLPGAPSHKRRKPSLLSTTSTPSTHPLRQTSFPPDGLDPRSYSPSARSPSVDTASLVSGSIAAGKASKKRGRKPKPGDDAGSLVGGRASTAVSIVSAGRTQRDGTRGASPEEDEDEGGEAMDVELVARTNEEKEKEKYYRSLLVDALDPDQYARYERWRSSKLADPVVRRVSALLPFSLPTKDRQFDVLTVPSWSTRRSPNPSPSTSSSPSNPSPKSSPARSSSSRAKCNRNTYPRAPNPRPPIPTRPQTRRNTRTPTKRSGSATGRRRAGRR